VGCFHLPGPCRKEFEDGEENIDDGAQNRGPDDRAVVLRVRRLRALGPLTSHPAPPRHPTHTVPVLAMSSTACVAVPARSNTSIKEHDSRGMCARGLTAPVSPVSASGGTQISHDSSHFLRGFSDCMLPVLCITNAPLLAIDHRVLGQWAMERRKTRRLRRSF